MSTTEILILVAAFGGVFLAWRVAKYAYGWFASRREGDEWRRLAEATAQDAKRQGGAGAPASKEAAPNRSASTASRLFLKSVKAAREFLLRLLSALSNHLATSSPQRKTTYILGTAVATIGVMAAVFVPGGLVDWLYGAKLGYLLPELIAGVVLVAVAGVVRWRWEHAHAPVVAVLIVGVGVGVAMRAVVARLATIYADFGGGAQDTVRALQAAEGAQVQAVLFPLGVAAILAARHHIARTRLAFLAQAGPTAALVYSGAIAWWGMSRLAGTVDVAPGMGIVIFAAFAALGLSRLGRYWLEAGNIVVAGVCRWSYYSWPRALGAGVLVGAYVGFVRPLMYHSLNYAVLLDWAAVVAVVTAVALFTGGQVNRLRHAAAHDQKWLLWKDHQLQVEVTPHEGIRRLSEVQKAFVLYGFKEDLVVYITAFLRDNRVPIERIVNLVSPVVNYQEPKPPALAVWGAMRKFEQRTQAERQALLQSVFAAIPSHLTPMPRGHVVRLSMAHLGEPSVHSIEELVDLVLARAGRGSSEHDQRT